jgi:hypothetical protein
LQVEPEEQLTEHEPVHVMLHVEFPVQDTLALGPTESVQFDPDAQFTLQESAQLPLQTL